MGRLAGDGEPRVMQGEGSSHGFDIQCCICTYRLGIGAAGVCCGGWLGEVTAVDHALADVCTKGRMLDHEVPEHDV